MRHIDSEQEEHVPLYSGHLTAGVKVEEKKPRIKEEDKPFVLGPEGVLRRLEGINQKPVVIENLDAEYIARTTSRVHFLSKRYGGNMQDVTPRPAQRFVKAHGIPQYCFLMPTWSPHAPRQPGEPGLTFMGSPECFRDPELTPTAIPTWVRRSSDRWQYIGHYRFLPSEPLSVEEWMSQDLVVRETRIACIFGTDWQTKIGSPNGKLVRYRCARHIAQRELQLAGYHRPATEEEVQRCLRERRYKEVTVDLVRNDFAVGLLTVAVCALECYGYDEKFQRELIEGFYQPRSTWARVFDDVKIEPLEIDVDALNMKRTIVRKRSRRGKIHKIQSRTPGTRLVLDCVEIVTPKWLERMRARNVSPEL